MSISRISMSRVAGLCLDVRVCVVWWYLCSLMLKKKSQGDISLKGGWKGYAPPLVCVKGGEYLSSDGLHEKSRLDDFIFCSPLHLRPIKWQNWQIRRTPPHLFFFMSYFLIFSFGVFILFFKVYSAGADYSFWNWPSSNVHFKHQMLP